VAYIFVEPIVYYTRWNRTHVVYNIYLYSLKNSFLFCTKITSGM